MPAGRGVGGRVTCPRPLPWRHPSGFAGVCFATVLGLGVWWSVRGSCVAVVGVDGAGYVCVRGCGRGCWPRCGWCCWPWWVSMVRAMCVFEGVRGCGRVCWLSSRSTGCLLVDDFCVFTGVGVVAGRRLGRRGRLGCLLVDDLCGAGVGFSGVRGCGWGCWLSSRSSCCLRVVASRVGEAAPRWCEASFEAVGRWRDTERCVIVTQHVVGWGGKHPNTRETPKNTKGCKKPDTPLTHTTHENTPLFEDAVGNNVAA